MKSSAAETAPAATQSASVALIAQAAPMMAPGAPMMAPQYTNGVVWPTAPYGAPAAAAGKAN